MCDDFPKKISLTINNKNESVFSKSKISEEPTTLLINNVKNELHLSNEDNNSKSNNVISNTNSPLIHRYRSRSEAPGSANFNKNNFQNDKSKNIRLTSNNNKICNESKDEYSSNFKKQTASISILSSNNKNLAKFEKKNVIGYNYFTNRRKDLDTDDSNIIKNLPLSIYVGTWNCEYFDFSKDYHYDKKRYTTNYLKKNTKENMYSTQMNDRYSVRAVTPLICFDSTKKLDSFYFNKKERRNRSNDCKDSKYSQNITKENKENKKISYNGNFDLKNSYNRKNLEYNSEFHHNMDITIINKNGKTDNNNSNNKYGKMNFNKKGDIEINKKKKSYDTLRVPGDDHVRELSLNENFFRNKDEIIDLKNLKNLKIENNEHKLEKSYDFLQIKKNYCPTSKSKEGFLFSHWIQPYYDIYVICLQESISDNIVEYLSMYLKEVNQETYVFLPLADYKLSGYGDGAFLQMKSTTIAAWVRKTKLYPNGPVKLCASKSISFNKLNNSKGCVSILLNIFNQFILFIGCHMPAKDQELRQKSREFILTKLSEYFSNKATSNFKDVFHHVIWMGDFNFRVHGIHLEKVIHYLKTNNLKELLKHDEGHSAYSCDLSISFQELPINFLPTYKKKGGRPIINKNDNKWVEKEYKLIHNIKWYKGGKQEPRIPSWTDRIFKWSCEKTKNCLAFIPNSYISPIPEEKSILTASDHNPVSCCFQMYKMKNEEDIPLTKVIFI
ncbi:endonuclease/exonuclease/phosphatase family protein, putative [Plasmodium gallinaceum]|uniref:Endonuclease/exonuclease/phosphatase family protein, putative n=1 Tax=Plasmodium gallinaceum TaxID=5849 RepID=A0A1J1GUI0_PLAGA|nr:endonuclease/exonuclease/phosphatase family protein, putative [Plasmodium gallinaceum]CRG96167.1 endonuclease/exonuclease/phosphatase family protein, putative [Plasmodium gallinaceum]